MAQQALTTPAEITSSNDSFTYNYNAGGVVAGTMYNGTYADALTVLYWFDIRLGAYNAGMYAYLSTAYKVVIATTGASLDLVWVDIPLMRLLGFRENLTGATSYTADDTLGQVWIPPYYSADTDRFRRQPNIIGGNAIDGTFSGISLAPSRYTRALRWEGVAAVDVYGEACEVSFLESGTITGVADLGGGVCRFSYWGHAIAVGDVVTVAGTTSYNDDQTVTAVGAGTFDAAEAFVADETGTYTITGTEIYPEEERCLEVLTIDALTASPTGTEGLSIKGAYYIEDLDAYTGHTGAASNCPSTMNGGGYRMHLTTSPDNFIFCALVPGRWFNPELPIENDKRINNVGLELTSAIGGVPTWTEGP